MPDSLKIALFAVTCIVALVLIVWDAGRPKR